MLIWKFKNMCITSPEEIRSAVLNELDGIAGRVGQRGGAEDGQEVVRWAERGGAVGSQMRVVAVGGVRPEHDLDRPSTEVRAQAVIGRRGVDRGDPNLESIKGHLDVDRRPLVGRPKRLLEAEAPVAPYQAPAALGADLDSGGPTH